jgi:hypothetical protein
MNSRKMKIMKFRRGGRSLKRIESAVLKELK